MGGSSKSGYFRSTPEKLLKKLQEAGDESRSATYDAQVADYLASLLSDYNERDHETIGRHLREIAKAFEEELEGTVDLMYGGSVAKHTYVDGLSDVDSLVMLENCELADRPPGEAKTYFAERLREYFPRAQIKEGQLAVTITFADCEIQLLPAISCKSAVKISDPSGDGWSRVKPQAFSRLLSEVNKTAGRKVVPTIKLAKAIISNLPENQRISGFHAEALGIQIFRNYEGDLKHKAMVKHFFDASSKAVMAPIRDRTGQSVHVDDYLGESGSRQRQMVADSFARVSRRMRNADNAQSMDEWDKLFGDGGDGIS